MEHLTKLINPSKTEILNVVEAISPPEKWNFIRSRILRALGKNGLEGRLIRFLGSGPGIENPPESHSKQL